MVKYTFYSDNNNMYHNHTISVISKKYQYIISIIIFSNNAQCNIKLDIPLFQNTPNNFIHKNTI